MLVEAHQGPSGVAPPHVPRRSCADGAARAAPPCSTEFPIPDDATMLLEISVVLQQLCDQNSDLRAKCPTKKSYAKIVALAVAPAACSFLLSGVLRW